MVEYSLTGYNNPIGVADWKEKIENNMPDEMKANLPTIEQIEKELE